MAANQAVMQNITRGGVKADSRGSRAGLREGTRTAAGSEWILGQKPFQ